VWIRHDDVVHYQKKKHSACLAGQPGNGKSDSQCDFDAKQSNDVCELIIYQSLSHETLSGGDGFSAGGKLHGDKLTADHDADRIDNHEHNSFNR